MYDRRRLRRYTGAIRDQLALTQRGNTRIAMASISTWMWSCEDGIMLRRDLADPITLVDARIPVELRPLETRDFEALFPADLEGRDFVEAARSRRIMEEGLPDRWVLADENDEACYCQWVVLPGRDPGLSAIFDPDTIRMADGQGLLEGAWTPPHRRGLRLASHAFSALCLTYRERGLDFLYTFIGRDNLAVRNALHKAGYRDYARRHTSWRLGRRTVHYSGLGSDLRTAR